MSFSLFADAEPVRGVMPFLKENWLVLLPIVLGFGAIYLLLPQVRRMKPLVGGGLAALALVLGAGVLIRTDTSAVESLLFYAFAGTAIIAGVMMITQSNPVHAALSFALVVLSTCGLFLLQAAPFLMAATIIIYAGAIVVTFLFVIMLAQQEGVSNADQRSREPFLASLAGCVLLAALLCVLQKNYTTRDLDGVIVEVRELSAVKDKDDIKRILGDPATKKVGERSLPIVAAIKPLVALFPENHKVHNDVAALTLDWLQLNVDKLKEHSGGVVKELEAERARHGSLALDAVPGKARTPGHFPPGKLPAANVAALGRAMFTDYLIPVELAATLLLVATIGAIAIARPAVGGYAMSPATLESYLIVGAVLFALGMVGFLTRRNMIIMFLSAEMMLQGVAINFVAFSKFRGDLGGQILVMFILAVAACEAAIALALIIMLYKRRKSLDVSVWQELREPDQDPIEDEGTLPAAVKLEDFQRLTPSGVQPPATKETEEVSHV